MKKRILALLMAALMVVSLVACGNQTTSTPDPTASTAPTPTAEPTKAPVAKVDPSVDFEDGKFDFTAVFQNFATADASTLEVADFNGSKALKITKADATKTPIVAIDIASLLGDKAADVASVSMTLGTSYADGTFSATSGQILFWTDTQLSKMLGGNWSVYTAKKNPYTIVTKVPDGVTIGDATPIVLVYFKEDLGKDKHGAATLYIDDIAFLDKDGKTIKPASTEVAFNAPAGFKDEKADRTNLYACSDYVDFPGFATKAGAWNQAGFDFTQEVLDAIVPGTTIEIEFSSEDGDLWLVFPNATPNGVAAWSRVAQGEAYINNSKTIAQIDYEQIVALLGEDKANWGPQLQCEGSSAWEVYSLKVGTIGNPKEFVKDVDFDGFATSAGAWNQDGFEMPQSILDALVPGTAVEIAFASDDNNLWIVFPDATPDGVAAWTRIAQNEAKIVDGKAYITYEQIVAAVGEDKANWGARMQCEGSSAWEVYAVAVGKFVEVAQTEYVKDVDFDGFATSAGAWNQDGFEMPQAILDALVPGTVVEIAFAADDNDLWIVFPDATPNGTAAWTRIAQQQAKIVDGKAYITYEQIVAAVGEDKANWGARMQCESSSAWEVYAVSVGKMVSAANEEYVKSTDFDGFATSAGAWNQDGFEMPQAILDALVPGTVVEIAFAADDNDLWIVFPDATPDGVAAWTRIAQQQAKIVDGKAYITYEQIVAAVGEDKANWGARMQCESSSAWEVYAVSVGKMQPVAESPRLHKFTNFDGFATSAGAWNQDGFEMPQAILDALVPGSVVEIAFASGDNDLWIVFPDATPDGVAAWSRIAQQQATIANGRAYITYEQIVAAVGEDKANWGARMQCEGSSAWEVYAVRVGQR